jgi:transposase
MKRVNLTRRQRERLEHQSRQARDARVLRRTLAILAWDRGERVTDIARILGVQRLSVYRWLDAFARSGDPAVLEERQRPGRPSLWTPECTDWLDALMDDYSPEAWGWEAVEWTVPLLQTQLAALAGHRFGEGTVRSALRGAGYVWKRPRYVLAPDLEEEKKTPDCSANRPFAAAQRGPGRGRDRSAALSTPARGLGPARPAHSGADFRAQRPAGDFRRAESEDGPPGV